MVAINANVLIQLVKTKSENKAKIGEINGELGASIKHHTELSGLDKAAFGFLCKLNGMKEQDRSQSLASLNLYADMMVEKRIWTEHVGDLANMAEQASNADQHGPSDDEQDEQDIRPPHLIEAERQRLAEEAQVTNNVTQLQRGIKPLEAVA
jgi:hypothetical protein